MDYDLRQLIRSGDLIEYEGFVEAYTHRHHRRCPMAARLLDVLHLLVDFALQGTVGLPHVPDALDQMHMLRREP